MTRYEFISGYFTDQFAAGKRPDYGYPKNNLPETTLEKIEVVTGFMAASKAPNKLAHLAIGSSCNATSSHH